MTTRKVLLTNGLSPRLLAQALMAAASAGTAAPTQAFAQTEKKGRTSQKGPDPRQHSHAVKVQERAARPKKLCQRVRKGFIVMGR